MNSMMAFIFMLVLLTIQLSPSFAVNSNKCNLTKSTVVDGKLCHQECRGTFAVVLKPSGFIPQHLKIFFSHFNTLIPSRQAKYANCQCLCVNQPSANFIVLYNDVQINPNTNKKELAPFEAIGKFEDVYSQYREVVVSGFSPPDIETPLHLHENAFSQLFFLKALIISDMAIDASPNSFPSSTVELLKLTSCLLTGIPNAVYDIDKPLLLDLFNNRLTSFPDKNRQIPYHWQLYLRTLNLSSNKLTSFPRGIFELSKLKSLTIFGNLITELIVNMEEKTFLEGLDNFVHDFHRKPFSLNCPNNTEPVVVNASTWRSLKPFNACLLQPPVTVVPRTTPPVPVATIIPATSSPVLVTNTPVASSSTPVTSVPPMISDTPVTSAPVAISPAPSTSSPGSASTRVGSTTVLSFCWFFILVLCRSF